ncbi:MAG: hypothetical protein ACI9VT_003043 [Psychroserpens sp.]
MEQPSWNSRRGTAVVEQPSWNSHRGAAAMKWVPFGNRSAEAEYFLDKRNEEVGHYGQTLVGISACQMEPCLKQKSNNSAKPILLLLCHAPLDRGSHQK